MMLGLQIFNETKGALPFLKKINVSQNFNYFVPRSLLELISGINQLGHHQRTALSKALDRLAGAAKVYNLIENTGSRQSQTSNCKFK